MNQRKGSQYREYLVMVHWIEEDDGDGYYIAYFPDFGWSACSAIGDTAADAIELLEQVKRDVIDYYVRSKKDLPEPSWIPFNFEFLRESDKG